MPLVCCFWRIGRGRSFGVRRARKVSGFEWENLVGASWPRSVCCTCGWGALGGSRLQTSHADSPRVMATLILKAFTSPWCALYAEEIECLCSMFAAKSGRRTPASWRVERLHGRFSILQDSRVVTVSRAKGRFEVASVPSSDQSALHLGRRLVPCAPRHGLGHCDDGCLTGYVWSCSPKRRSPMFSLVRL